MIEVSRRPCKGVRREGGGRAAGGRWCRSEPRRASPAASVMQRDASASRSTAQPCSRFSRGPRAAPPQPPPRFLPRSRPSDTVLTFARRPQAPYKPLPLPALGSRPACKPPLCSSHARAEQERPGGGGGSCRGSPGPPAAQGGRESAPGFCAASAAAAAPALALAATRCRRRWGSSPPPPPPALLLLPTHGAGTPRSLLAPHRLRHAHCTILPCAQAEAEPDRPAAAVNAFFLEQAKGLVFHWSIRCTAATGRDAGLPSVGRERVRQFTCTSPRMDLPTPTARAPTRFEQRRRRRRLQGGPRLCHCQGGRPLVLPLLRDHRRRVGGRDCGRGEGTGGCSVAARRPPPLALPVGPLCEQRGLREQQAAIRLARPCISPPPCSLPLSPPPPRSTR